MGALSHQNGGKPIPSQTTDLETDFRDLRLTITDLMQTDGYSHVMAVVAGVACLLPLFTLLNRKGELKSFAEIVVKYLEASDNPEDSHSIAFARNQHASDFLVQSQIISSRLDVLWMTNFSEARNGGEIQTNSVQFGPGDHDNPGAPSLALLQSATGSLLNGFSVGRRVSQRSANLGDNPWYPELSHWNSAVGFDVSWNEMVGNLESHRQAAIAQAASEAQLNDCLVQIRQIITVLKAA